MLDDSLETRDREGVVRGEGGLHAEEVSVEDGGEGDLVDHHLCEEGEKWGGIVEGVSQVDEPISLVLEQSSPFQSSSQIPVPLSLLPLSPEEIPQQRTQTSSPSITRNRRPRPNNQSPPSPLRLIVPATYSLCAQVAEEIHNHRAHELRRPRACALRSAEEGECRCDGSQTLPQGEGGYRARYRDRFARGGYRGGAWWGRLRGVRSGRALWCGMPPQEGRRAAQRGCGAQAGLEN